MLSLFQFIIIISVTIIRIITPTSMNLVLLH